MGGITEMKSPTNTMLQLLLLISPAFLLIKSHDPAASAAADPLPTLWPHRFHTLLYMNLTATGRLLVTDLWYDWPLGRNMNRMQQQLDAVLYDVEWDNGTSYYFTKTGTCLIRHFSVGIPRPDWLLGSTYLGLEHTDGFLCHVWEKLDFIWYYEDVETQRPVRWDFFDGISTHVMTFEEGAVLEDSEWQAPSYCFTSPNRSGAAIMVTRIQSWSISRAQESSIVLMVFYLSIIGCAFNLMV